LAQKVYLLTSPEKFHQKDGDGSSNGGSPTPTGNLLLAILRPKEELSSQSPEALRFSRLVEKLLKIREMKKELNGDAGVTPMSIPMSLVQQITPPWKDS